MKTPHTITEHGDLVPNAVVSNEGEYGFGTQVYQYATVESDCIIGHHVVIGSSAFVGSRCHIGDGTRIQHGAFLARGSKLGKNVFIGPLAILTDDKHPRVDNHYYKAEPPVLEDGCSIGAGAIILPGVRVGRNAMVGAGAVVTKDVPAGATVTKVPAVGHKSIYTTAELEKLTENPLYEEIGGVFFKKVEREGFGIE